MIIDEEPNPLPETVSPFFKHLIRMLLDKNPEKRPDAAQLLNYTEIRASVMKVMDLAAQEMIDDKDAII